MISMKFNGTLARKWTFLTTVGKIQAKQVTPGGFTNVYMFLRIYLVISMFPAVDKETSLTVIVFLRFPEDQ
jgi:hypothetical protein